MDSIRLSLAHGYMVSFPMGYRNEHQYAYVFVYQFYESASSDGLNTRLLAVPRRNTDVMAMPLVVSSMCFPVSYRSRRTTLICDQQDAYGHKCKKIHMFCAGCVRRRGLIHRHRQRAAKAEQTCHDHECQTPSALSVPES